MLRTVFSLPLLWGRFFLARLAQLLLQVLMAMGARPRGLASRAELEKQQLYIDGLHSQLDRSRQLAESERAEKERQRLIRAKAVKKLDKARAKLEDLQRYAEDAQLEGQRTEIVLRPGPTFKKTGLATHIMLWSAVFFTSAFHSSLPSLQQKLLASIITPVVLVYFLVQTTTRHSLSTVLVQCTSMAVLGFLLHRFLSGGC